MTRSDELVAQVEALAQRPDLRFFHWEIEFPEVFFGFVDADAAADQAQGQDRGRLGRLRCRRGQSALCPPGSASSLSSRF